MPVRVAVVEDDEKAAATLKQYLIRYGEEKQISFKIRMYSNAISILEQYSADYDIIFMDIRMPYLNGMDAAHRLRVLDSAVALIFVTSLTQYAVSGYEVDAMDYIIKPVNYYDFVLKLSRVLKRIGTDPIPAIVVPTDAGMTRLNPKEIRYIETQGHHVIYHTLDGEYTQYAAMNKLEEQFEPYGFARCNSCYLVNLQYVVTVKGYTATLDTGTLKISQPRKKKFLQAFVEFWEKNNG